MTMYRVEAANHSCQKKEKKKNESLPNHEGAQELNRVLESRRRLVSYTLYFYSPSKQNGGRRIAPEQKGEALMDVSYVYTIQSIVRVTLLYLLQRKKKSNK